MHKIITLSLLMLTQLITAQLDEGSVMGLPVAQTIAEMNAITAAAQGSIVYNNEDDLIYYFDGVNWITFLSQNRGLQYYTWNINNTVRPNIDSPRNLGVPSSEGLTNTVLNNTTRGAVAPDNDGYILKFNGVIRVENTGNFTFSARSDDGSRIYIDNVLVLENWFDQGPTTRSNTINLAKGEHVIEFWYYENAGGDFMQFTWGNNPDGYVVGSTIDANQFFIK